MSIEILTREDLNDFKYELLNDIQQLLNSNEPQSKKWLRTKEVLKILQISAGTLQNYRINGVLKYSRIGKALYYSIQDIEAILKNNLSTA